MPITEANFAEELVVAVPETGDLVTDHLRDNFGELLLHPLMADLLRFAVRNFHSGSRELSHRLLAFVDRALRTGDAAVQNAVAVSFVEHIGAYPGETPEFIASWPVALRREKDRQNPLSQDR